jgi:hypothetical protein
MTKTFFSDILKFTSLLDLRPENASPKKGSHFFLRQNEIQILFPILANVNKRQKFDKRPKKSEKE